MYLCQRQKMGSRIAVRGMDMTPTRSPLSFSSDSTEMNMCPGLCVPGYLAADI